MNLVVSEAGSRSEILPRLSQSRIMKKNTKSKTVAVLLSGVLGLGYASPQLIDCEPPADTPPAVNPPKPNKPAKPSKPKPPKKPAAPKR